MKTLLLLIALSLTLMQTNTALAQGNPCPCDCDEILSSATWSNRNNYLHMVKSRDGDCYTLELTLKACGNRTLRGFSISLPSPNCFEGKNINVTMDGVDLGTVDLGNTSIPTMFQLDSPLLPCTSRNISFKFCFPDDDAECLNGNSNVYDYEVDIDYQFNPNDPPCETQTAQLGLDIIPDIASVNQVEILDLFHINSGVLKLKDNLLTTSIFVYDISGKNILTSSNNILDMSELNSGTYIILIQEGNNYIKTTYINQK